MTGIPVPGALDLSRIRLVDNHCHALLPGAGADVAGWRALFSESPDEQMRHEHVTRTAFYSRLIRSLAGFYGVAAEEDAVLQARAARSEHQRLAELFTDAGIDAVVLDTGFPDPGAALDAGTFGRIGGVRTATLVRLELLFGELVATAASYDELVDAVDAALSDVRAAGHAGFKSIAGYRTGLDIRRWPVADARQAFAAARRVVAETGTVRLGHQPLLDSLLHRAFAAASEQQLPVQFHVGYGDPDADLRKAAPLELRPVLEERAYRGMSVVLLHGCWPYVREGAYLASVYGNVYLDLSYAIPFLSRGELVEMTRAAVSVAPLSRLMYSSDGVRVPELYWTGAHEGRRALGIALGRLVSDGDLSGVDAMSAAEAILAGTARSLYGLPVTG